MAQKTLPRLEINGLEKTIRLREKDEKSAEWDFHDADTGAVWNFRPNGAGKSTLIGIITGGLIPDAGQVLWNGRSARGIHFGGSLVMHAAAKSLRELHRTQIFGLLGGFKGNSSKKCRQRSVPCSRGGQFGKGT